MTKNTFFAPHALLVNNWAQNVLLEWDAAGQLTRVEANARYPQGAPFARGPIIPAMPNLHSHAHQRAMAGLTEVRGLHTEGHDSFWTWRKLMYGFANVITPPQLEAIATWLYIEMLEAGYTSVCEFHYLHHDLTGQPYADATEMCQALIRAANTAGIGLTLLPVLYQSAAFGGAPTSTMQRRFVHGTDQFLNLLQQLAKPCAVAQVRFGFAPHSLRAVTPTALRDVIAGADAIDPTMPIHIHIAEQQAEVDDCVAWSGGATPVRWLINNAPIDDRWCLVHATHMSDREAAKLAKSGAVVGLCPTTEANLGDGVFKGSAWTDARGRWGIGSDSHICINAARELQQLEYSQRLRTQSRNVMSHMNGSPHLGTALTLAAVAGGAAASGRDVAGLHLGQQADWIELSAEHPTLAALPSAAHMLDAHVFAGDGASTILNVVRAGRVVVQNSKHMLHDAAAAGFVKARKAMLDAVQ